MVHKATLRQRYLLNVLLPRVHDNTVVLTCMHAAGRTLTKSRSLAPAEPRASDLMKDLGVRDRMAHPSSTGSGTLRATVHVPVLTGEQQAPGL